jgi:hypothetical protein
MATFEGSVSSLSTFNSASLSNSFSVVSTGHYTVTFPGLGNGLHSNAQVNAYNTDGKPHICETGSWGSSNGTDVFVNVYCYDFAGNAAAGDFSVFYQSRGTAPGGWLGFIWADQPSAASYTPNVNWNYNSRGGANTVTRSSAGVYSVTFGSLRGGGNPQVTAYSSTGSPAHCEVTGWNRTGTSTTVGVACFNSAGTPTDEYYSLAYNRSALASEGVVNGLFGFAYNPTRRNYTPHEYYSEFGGVYPTAQRFGVPAGQYSLTASDPSSLTPSPWLGMVTAVGTGGEYCEIDGYEGLGTSFDNELVCYDSAERQTNTAYSGAMFFELH